jgi:tryptophan synthase beta chain
VLHGARTYLVQNGEGQIAATHSVSAGLDYPGVGPEHAHLRSIGRVTYESVDDDAACDAFRALARLEGIVPALESAHAIAQARRIAATLPNDAIVLATCSGRGDKDALQFALDRTGAAR